MENASARNLWGDYLDKHLEFAFAKEPSVGHFSENETAANENVNEILKGRKRAMTHSLIAMQSNNEKLPKVGDFKIITDGNDNAKCIVRVTEVKLKPFFSIDGTHAKNEGHSDLDSWKKSHWTKCQNQLQPFGKEPKESMIMVCEKFEKVFEK